MYTLRRNHRTSAVKLLQETLGIKADGIYGSDTERAVKAFQTANNLIADGLAGRKTLAALGILDEVSELQEAENCDIDVSDVKQFDSPHGNKVYGGRGYSTYAKGGCCPTSLTVVIRNYYNPDIAVEDIGEEIYEGGYRYKGSGTSPNAIGYIMKEYGGSAKKINYWDIQKYLKQGCLIILHIKEGFDNTYGGNGHYIVCYGIENGELLLQDVGSNKARRQWARTYKLPTGIKGVYVCLK